RRQGSGPARCSRTLRPPCAIGGPGGKPTPPLNLVGDFGGGALYLALGVAAALFEAARSGKGQVVDAAMTDGASSLMTVFHMFQALGQWSDKRGANLLDGGAHFYDTYETADGKYVAVGAIEPQFYALLRDKLGLADSAYDAQMNPQGWPDLKQKLAAVFATKTRDAWCEILEGTDACFAPVLTMAEAAGHPHNRARETLIERDGVRQPNAAPRFSRTACEIGLPSPAVGADNDTVFEDWSVDPGAIASLKDRGAI
ncbi:MAG: CaiB/BaiF CoA-transferase family protein, partial [Pseudomonadota bacterium]